MLAMRGRLLALVAIAATPLLLPAPLFGQSRSDSLITVEGTIWGPADRPLAGVSVVALGAGRAAVTDARGTFRLRLPQGTHQVHIRTEWFALARRTITVTGPLSFEVELDGFLLPYCDERGRPAGAACAVLVSSPPSEWPRGDGNRRR